MKSKIKQLNAIHIIFIIMFIIIVIACIAMGINTISQFNASAISAYNNAKNQTADEISGNLYQKGFNQAEESYHVSNRATLSIGDIKEVSQLEVLNVSDIEFVATDPNENDADITAILEVPGMGV
jgi:hypothetical protein